MLKRVFSTDDRWCGVAGAGDDELIVGADASVGVRLRVEQSAGDRVRARLGNVEGVEVQPKLADVQVGLQL